MLDPGTRGSQNERKSTQNTLHLTLSWSGPGTRLSTVTASTLRSLRARQRWFSSVTRHPFASAVLRAVEEDCFWGDRPASNSLMAYPDL